MGTLSFWDEDETQQADALPHLHQVERPGVGGHQVPRRREDQAEQAIEVALPGQGDPHLGEVELALPGHGQIALGVLQAAAKTDRLHGGIHRGAHHLGGIRGGHAEERPDWAGRSPSPTTIHIPDPRATAGLRDRRTRTGHHHGVARNRHAGLQQALPPACPTGQVLGHQKRNVHAPSIRPTPTHPVSGLRAREEVARERLFGPRASGCQPGRGPGPGLGPGRGPGRGPGPGPLRRHVSNGRCSSTNRFGDVGAEMVELAASRSAAWSTSTSTTTSTLSLACERRSVPSRPSFTRSEARTAGRAVAARGQGGVRCDPWGAPCFARC